MDPSPEGKKIATTGGQNGLKHAEDSSGPKAIRSAPASGESGAIRQNGNRRRRFRQHQLPGKQCYALLKTSAKYRPMIVRWITLKGHT